jgi:hypothetical protein
VADETPTEPKPDVRYVGQLLYTLLERQGLAVVLVLVGLLWATGLLPFRVCESASSQRAALEALERDRSQIAQAISDISRAIAEQTKVAQRMDSRDSIRTCSLIADKEARLSCLNVAVSHK